MENKYEQNFHNHWIGSDHRPTSANNEVAMVVINILTYISFPVIQNKHINIWVLGAYSIIFLIVVFSYEKKSK